MWKTYPVTLAPRDEEPSLSSSEEKSSEFDWLENNEKNKNIYEKQSKCSVAIFLTYTKGCLQEQAPKKSIYFVKKITNIYKRLFTPLFLLKD